MCAPVEFYAAAHSHGRTLFAPTAHIRSDVGGGVPDAPAITRTLRADIESAPTHGDRYCPAGAVGEHSICSRRILRCRPLPQANTVRPYGPHMVVCSGRQVPTPRQLRVPCGRIWNPPLRMGMGAAFTATPISPLHPHPQSKCPRLRGHRR